MTITLERPAPPKAPPPPPRRDWDRGRGGRPEPSPPVRVFVTLLVAAVTMFFFGLVSALLARAGTAGWTPAPRPPVLWLGLVMLVASSVLLERGERALRNNRTAQAAQLLRWGGLLGVGFLAGQVAAWWQLASSGIGLAAGPGASYFYVLSGAHLLHVVGGLVAWAAVLRKLQTPGFSLWGLRVYWHFLALLWVFLFAILFTR